MSLDLWGFRWMALHELIILETILQYFPSQAYAFRRRGRDDFLTPDVCNQYSYSQLRRGGVCDVCNVEQGKGRGVRYARHSDFEGFLQHLLNHHRKSIPLYPSHRAVVVSSAQEPHSTVISMYPMKVSQEQN